jgi:hypothetical protein
MVTLKSPGNLPEISRFPVRYWYGISPLTIINHDVPSSMGNDSDHRDPLIVQWIGPERPEREWLGIVKRCTSVLRTRSPTNHPKDFSLCRPSY